MAKGSAGRFIPALAGLLVLLAGGKASPAPKAGLGLPPGPAWWEVRLLVSVRGEYKSWDAGGGPRRPAVIGDYSYRARWEGRLDPDGDDFLLVHLKTEVLEWRLGEKAGPPGEETRLEALPASAPELRLDYVLREGRSLEFSVGLDGCIDLPLHGRPGKVFLLLPRSASRPDGLPGDRYDDFLTAGSNSIVLPDTDLARRRPVRSFSWKWERGVLGPPSRPGLADGAGFSDAHSVEAVVTLAAR
jgi:hypothetical protein